MSFAATLLTPLPGLAAPPNPDPAPPEVDQTDDPPVDAPVDAPAAAPTDDSPIATPPDATVPVPPDVLAPIEPDPLAGATRLDADGLFESEQRAYALYMEGVHALQDAEDPDLAIDKWRQAVSVLPDERPYARSRGALALRLVTACELRFLRDGNIEDLRTQSALLKGYQARLSEMFPDDRAARARRRDHAQARIDEIDAELRRIAGDHGTVEEQLDRSLRGEYEARGQQRWRPDPTDAGWHARPDDPRKHAQQAADQEVAPEEHPMPEAEPEPPKPQGTGLIVTGAVLGVAGLAGVGVGFAGMAKAAAANKFDATQSPSARRAQIARGNQGNVQSVVGIATGSALAVTGAVLLAVGVKKRKRTSRIEPGLAVGNLMGITVAGRF